MLCFLPVSRLNCYGAMVCCVLERNIRAAHNTRDIELYYALL